MPAPVSVRFGTRLASMHRAALALLVSGLRRCEGDLNFDRFSHDPKGDASSLRLIGNVEVDLFSTEFVEKCGVAPEPPSLTSLVRGSYQPPPCRGDEIEVDDGLYPGQRRYAVCAPGPCAADSDCPISTLPAAPASCTYLQASTGLRYCERRCAADPDCLGPDQQLVRCMRGRCMASTVLRNMSLPRSVSQRFDYPQYRQDPQYNALPNITYMDDGQLDNPYSGRVALSQYTEIVQTKDFVRDGDLLPLPHNRTHLCHYALRLTPPVRAQNAAVWSKFKQTVVYGFVTEFHFRVLHRTKECKAADLASEWCSDAGADGFAFVIQNVNRKVVGTQVGGIGYAFPKSLVIEFDMYRDAEFGDPSSNHISVMIPERFDQPNSADHAKSEVLSTSDIPALQEGTHIVRIEYDVKNFRWDSLGKDFVADLSPEYLKKHLVGRPGRLTIWIDGRRVLLLPIDLIYIVGPDPTATATANPPLQPNASAYDELGQSPGKAWVGFTSSTNYFQFQSVDILSWTFKEETACPLYDVDRHAYCDQKWSPPNPHFPVSVPTYDTEPVSTVNLCFYDGSQLCHIDLQNAARQPIRVYAHTRYMTPEEGSACRDSDLQWNHMHPHFLGCSRLVFFTEVTTQLWITTADLTRTVVISDNQILQKAPAPFKRRNYREANKPWKWCVREHKTDPSRLSFAECNCEYCVRMLDLQASYAVFYQQKCSARYGVKCPCFEASGSQHDSSAWVKQEPLTYMRVHICRGCAYHSQCSHMLKVAVCEDAYQTYTIGNPLAPTILANGFKDLLRDRGNVLNGQIRGDSCFCEPSVRPYAGNERTGMCKEVSELLLRAATVPTLTDCANQCRGSARCSFFVFFEAGVYKGDCLTFVACAWQPCTELPTPEAVERCFASSTYRLAPLGAYADVRDVVQRFNVFPRRTLQTNFDECKQCLWLYDEEYCNAQCGQATHVPYTHWPAGQLCATCMFAGNRMHEMTEGETRAVKACVYEAIRDSRDPWEACNDTAVKQGGAESADLFNGVATHYLSECPGRAFPQNGAVCVPNLWARLDFPLQVLSRMSAKNDTVWDDQLQCLNAQCQLVPKRVCYEKLSIFQFTLNMSDALNHITASRYGNPLPVVGSGYLTFLKVSPSFGVTRQYALTSPLPWTMENFTIEAWVRMSPEPIQDVALGGNVESNAQWYHDYVPFFGLDGDPGTYWSSQLGNPGNVNLNATWICDLGVPRYAGLIRIYWKEPAEDFTIAVRNAETDDWQLLVTVVGNKLKRTDHYNFFEARFLRLYMTKAATTRPDLMSLKDVLQKKEPLRYPVYSIYEFEVLKDDQVSRLKPTAHSDLWHRPLGLALDGDVATYWASKPGLDAADFVLDFGETLTVNVLKIDFHYRPEIISVFGGAVPCGACPWTETSFRDDLMQCLDGTYVDVTQPATGRWNGCNMPGTENKGGRAKCPPNYPFMCEQSCDAPGAAPAPPFDEKNWCCATDCSPYGGLRTCTPEDAKPSGAPLWSGIGSTVPKQISLSGVYRMRCLTLRMDRAGLVYGDRLVGVSEIQAYTAGANIGTADYGATAYQKHPNVAEAQYAMDDDPATNWLVIPPTDGNVMLTIDLGRVKRIMSLEVIFSTIDGRQYKTGSFVIRIGVNYADMVEVDRVVGFAQMSRSVLLGMREARYVMFEALQIYVSNPDRMFGLQDFRVLASSDNICQRNTTMVSATSAWTTPEALQFAVYQDGEVFPHHPTAAIDDDYDTWWGAELGISGIAGTGAGIAVYEFVLAEPQALSMVSILWRFPSDQVIVLCAADLAATYLQVGAVVGNQAMNTAIAFYGTRSCQRIRLRFGLPLWEYASEGIIGVRELELHNFADDYALRKPALDSRGESGAEAVDPDVVSRWASSGADPVNFTVDLGEPVSAWGMRVLMQSSIPARTFAVAISNGSNHSAPWAADSDYSIVESFPANFLADAWVLKRIVARYVRVIFLSTQYSAFSIRALQVLGGTNFALNSTVIAPKSWNHSGHAVVDGDPNTFWVAEPLATASRLRVDLKEEYFIAGGVAINWKFAAEDFEVLSSRDGVTWELIHNETGNLANVTEVGRCFEARYIEVRMTRPDKLNGDGAYGIIAIIVRFDSNLAHCKTVTVNALINSTLFVESMAHDGKWGTIWMPEQGSISPTLVWDLEGDMLVSGFELEWRYPPRSFYMEYEHPDRLGNWTLINQWGPSPVPSQAVDLFDNWNKGFPARRMRLVVIETMEHDEGRLCALRDTKVYYPTSLNLLLYQTVTVSDFYGEHIGGSITDGNERGTYWRTPDGVQEAEVVITLPPLPPPRPTDPPPGHPIGRILILWRYMPGDVKVELFYDTIWITVYEGYGATALLRTDILLKQNATSVRLTVTANNPLTPQIGILQMKAFRVGSTLVPTMINPYPPWTASASSIIDTVSAFSTDSDTDSYWMSPHNTNEVEVVIDLFKVYNAYDISIWFGFRAQTVELRIATNETGPWTLIRTTSRGVAGLMNLEDLSGSFDVRYVKIRIIRGFFDVEGLFGTSIRDFGVYLFRNWARNTSATSDSVWDYDPDWIVSGNRSKRWVSRFDTDRASLTLDLYQVVNIAGMSIEFEWGCGRFTVFYKAAANDTWTDVVIQRGDGLVQVPTTVHFKARYLLMEMKEPLVRVYHPDTPGIEKTDRTVFSVLDWQITSHPGGGGAFGIQSLDGLQYTTIAYGLREPGEWMIASEGQIMTQDLGMPKDFEFDTWHHWAVTFQTVKSEDLRRLTSVRLYKDGQPYGSERQYWQPFNRLIVPNSTRIVMGIRSSAHSMPDANSWPPPTSGLAPNLREANTPNRGRWPASNDPVKHGASHSPYFAGAIDRLTVIRNALSPEEVRGIYLDLELGCHCYDACPTGSNVHFPDVQVPCSGQGVCRRYPDAIPLSAGYCECLPGYSGANCERHCTHPPSVGCCEEDDDCPLGKHCDATKACV